MQQYDPRQEVERRKLRNYVQHKTCKIVLLLTLICCRQQRRLQDQTSGYSCLEVTGISYLERRVLVLTSSKTFSKNKD